MRTMLATALVVGLSLAARADEVGPNKGPVAEWGSEEYHLEVVQDTKAGTVTVYVYGGHEDLDKGKKKAIDAKTITLVLKSTSPATTVKLEAAPEKDDPKGSTTKFTATNDVFKKEMKLSGTISGKIGTKPYSGDFKQK